MTVYHFHFRILIVENLAHIVTLAKTIPESTNAKNTVYKELLIVPVNVIKAEDCALNYVLGKND